MKVLILGGTGAMGVHLVQHLSSIGVDTTVTSRRARCSEKNVRYIGGNAHRLGFLQTIFHERWDAIVDFMVYTTAEFEERVGLLLKATSQYIFLSSGRVYAESESPITEASPRLLDVCQDKEFLETDEYALAKARQENILVNSGRMNWTIIRPYITYSENRLQLGGLELDDWLYRALQGRTIVCSGEISSKFTTMTYGLDVAKGIIAIIGEQNALGESFGITSGRPVKWNDVLTIYLNALEKHLGERPPVLFVDRETYDQCNPAQYKITYDRLFDRTFDNTKISKYIDVDDFVQIEDGLTCCLERFLKNPAFKGRDWRKEARKDRWAKERASMEEISGPRQKARYLKFRYFKDPVKY